MNLGASISSNDWKGHGSAGSSLKWALIRSFKGRTAKEEEVLESSKNFGGQAEDDLRRSGRGGGGGSSSNNIWSATTTSRLEILSGLRRTRSWRRCTREDNALYSQLYHIFQHRKNGCLFQLNSAKVIGVGPGKVSKNGNVIPVCVKEGDTVLLPEYGGTSVKLGEDDLEKMGALEWQKVVKEHQGWRLITCIWLHAGVIHLLANMLSLVFIGIRLEQEFGFARIGTVYLVSAFGGSVLSALFNQNGVSVGASGALFGLLGAMLSELITNWTIYASKFAALVTLLFIIVVNLAFGLLPHVDNFAHIGGFISGFLLGFVFLMRPQFGWVNRKIIPPGYDVNSVVKSKHNAYQYILGLLSLILLIVGTQGSNIITCSFRVQT